MISCKLSLGFSPIFLDFVLTTDADLTDPTVSFPSLEKLSCPWFSLADFSGQNGVFCSLQYTKVDYDVLIPVFSSLVFTLSSFVAAQHAEHFKTQIIRCKGKVAK
jgi:hypothetical protein